MTRPIEPMLRSGVAADDDVVAVRGRPLTVEKLLDQAAQEARRHTWQGRPFAAISVFCTVDGWTVEAILRDILSTRSTFAAARLGELRGAGFTALPTHHSPHFDLALPEVSERAASTLLEALGSPQPNPHRARRR